MSYTVRDRQTQNCYIHETYYMLFKSLKVNDHPTTRTKAEKSAEPIRNEDSCACFSSNESRDFDIGMAMYPEELAKPPTS